MIFESETSLGRLPESVERAVRQVDLPIRIEDIPDGKQWLFLNGFEDPDPNHQAFDFSAYETVDGRTKLGIPSTILRAPISGRILRANDDTKSTWNTWGEQGYKGEIEIMGVDDDCIITAILAHVVPTSGLAGRRVQKAAVIGKTFESPNADKGTLGHLHFQLEVAFPGQKSLPIDPLKYLMNGASLRRIFLPHSGPFTKTELQQLGVEIQYADELDYLIAAHHAME